MADDEARRRRQRQRQLAKAARAGVSPLGGEFAEHYERAVTRKLESNFPPPAAPAYTRPSAWDAEIAAAQERAEHLANSAFPEIKDPTATEWPATKAKGARGPRSSYAEYDPTTQVLRIWWDRPGRLGPYTNYYDVTPQEWDQIENVVSSTGKYVNRVLNYKYYDYE